MSGLTRKHFQLIADAVNDADLVDYRDRVRVAYSLANALRTTNHNFDRARFVAACGVDE